MTPSRALRYTLAALFYVGWALLFTFPLLLRFGDSVTLSRGGDAWLHIWDLWWVDKALVSLHQSPYFTNFIFYPTGLNLYYQSLDLVNALVSIALQHLLGLTATYNLLLVANLTLDGLVAFWLCLDRTGSWGASLVGGALFASAPLLGTSVERGQLDEVTAWWIPLYILALWRALDSPGMPWQRGGGRRATVAAGLCLVGASLATWYFTAGLAIFTVIFVPCLLLSKRREGAGAPRAWLEAAAKVAEGVLILAVLLSPLLAAMIRVRLSGATYMLPALGTTIFNSVDLLAFLLPARLPSPINGHGNAVALGYVALFLAAVGATWRWRRLWPLTVALLVVLVMSMGPILLVNGSDTGIALPYAVLNNVPFVGASRQPLRFLATAEAIMALLASFGMLYLLTRLPRRRAVLVLLPLALLLVAVELVAVPRALASTSPDPATQFIRDGAASGAILEVPYDESAAPALLHQTVHGRPIVGGYTSRHNPYPFAQEAPGVAQLVQEDPSPLLRSDIVSPPLTQTALSSLDYYGIRYVVVHKDALASGNHAALEQALGAMFPPSDIVYQDNDAVVYQVPDLSSEGLPLVGLGTGWYGLEQNPPHRWLGKDGSGGGAAWVGIPKAAEGDYRLDLNAFSYKSPRTLTVYLDGQPKGSAEVGTSPQALSVALGKLGEGDHTIELRVDKPPETPPGDTRHVSIGLTALSLVRTSP